jgi:hypothetical protein
MTRLLATLAAAFVLIGPASAQSQGGAAGDTGAVETQTYPVPRKSGGRPADTPKVRDQLLRGAFDVLLQPRPKRRPPEAAPQPVMVIPDPPAVIAPPFEAPAEATPEPIPPPLPASVAVTPAAAPAPAPRPAIAPAKLGPTPRPDPRAEQPPDLEPAAPPPVVEPPQSTPPVAVSPPPAPPIIEPAGPIKTPVPATPEQASNKNIWPLLGLLAAIVIAATALYPRRARQIARTRAALSLNPSLDPLAGAFSASGLALAGPSIAIRARLDLNEALRG